MDSRRERLDKLVNTVSGGDGVLPRTVRRALAGGQHIAGELGELAALVAAGGLGVTDENIRRLLACGHSEGVLFVAAAVGAGSERLRAVERLLQERRV